MAEERVHRKRHALLCINPRYQLLRHEARSVASIKKKAS